MDRRSTRRVVRFLALPTTLVVLSGCPGSPSQRDLNDSTAPTLGLSVTASKNTASGVETVQFGNDIELAGAGGSVFVKAEDDDGVAWVELWMTTTRNCGGVVEGPGLSGQPADRVEGTVTATEAPSDLTAGVDINLLGLTPGCTYTFAVKGKAANAATTAVVATSSTSKLTLVT